MKVLDLFSGIGGFSLGLEQAGFETVAFCEIETYCQNILNKHWPNIRIIDDVKEVKADLFPDVNVICGGFPCQDISIAGKGAGIEKGERSGLWRQFKRCIHEIKPEYAIIENVSALLGRGLNLILKDLAKIGYDATWTTFDSQYFGVPQRRRRVYIIAVRDGIPSGADIFKFNERTGAGHRSQVEAIQKSRQWYFEKGEGEREGTAFFTRQRSNEFACVGLSGTLAKRDYKSFTDLVLQDGRLRRVTPAERLSLQGIPRHWLDVDGMTDTEKFKCNGMTVPVVKYIGDCINDFRLRYNR